jgi:hypothetical protein
MKSNIFVQEKKLNLDYDKRIWISNYTDTIPIRGNRK